MKLKLENFKCHRDTKIDFEQDQTIMLSGANGSGKTTIFKAIQWCLYGGTNVGPNSTKKVRTIVTLKIDGIKIQRKTNSASLSYKTNNTEKLDSEAQEMIVEKFGSKDFWSCCCYLVQGQTNSIFTGTLKQRDQILSELVSVQFLDKTITKVKSRIETKQNKIETLSTKVKTSIKMIKSLEKQHSLPRDCWKDLPIERRDFCQVVDLNSNILNTQRRLDNVKEKILQKQSKIALLRADLEEILSQNIVDNIQDLEQKLVNAKVSLEIQSQRKKGKIEVSQLTLDSWQRIFDIQTELLKVFQRFDVCYNRQNLENVVDTLQSSVERRTPPPWPMLEKIQTILNSVDDVNNKAIFLLECEKVEASLAELAPGWRLYTSDLIDKTRRFQKSIQEKDIETMILVLQSVETKDVSFLLSIFKVFQSGIRSRAEAAEYQLQQQIREKMKLYNIDITNQTSVERVKSLLISGWPTSSATCPCCMTELTITSTGNLIKGKTNFEQSRLVEGEKTQKILQYIEKYIPDYIFADVDSQLINASITLTQGVEDFDQFLLTETVRLFEKSIGKRLRANIDIKTVDTIISKVEFLDLTQEKRSQIEKEFLLVGPDILSKVTRQQLEDDKHFLVSTKLQKNLDLILERLADRTTSYSNQELGQQIDRSFVCQSNVESFNTDRQIKQLELDLKKGTESWLKINKLSKQLSTLDIDLKEMIVKIKAYEVELLGKEPLDTKVQQEIDVYRFARANIDNLLTLKGYTERLCSANTKVDWLQDFYHQIRSKRKEVIRSRVTHLNRTINEICSSLFEKPIIVKISPEKSLKNGSKSDGAAVTFSIGDNPVCNFAELSGGEAEKISFAITMAVSLYCSFPLILLDECASFVDTTSRPKFFDCIKKYRNNKSAIVINHHYQKGFFDSVIVL